MIMFTEKKVFKVVFPLLAFLMLGNAQVCLGQAFSDTYTTLKSKFPEEQAVYNKYYEDVDISIVDDSLVVKSRHYKEMVHMGSMSHIYARENIYSSLFYQVGDIQASTLIPHKRRYKKLKVTEMKETFDKNSQVFYDDTRVITFMYPAIEPGVHTVLEYEETIKDPRFAGSFFFSNNARIVHGRYTLTMDEGVEVALKLLHDNDKRVKISKEKVGSRIKYVYEIFDSERIKSESNTPGIKYYTTHLNLIIRSFTNSKGAQIKVLDSPDDLFAWYRTFIEGLRHYPGENVKSVVEELVKGTDSEQEKVKRIFYWVQENIKYIAFEDGMRGLIPHNGAYVCEKRFGDCKDMASILVNMMQQAGIEAYFTWIGTRDIPYDYSEMPSPLVDNHMIATYINGGQYYFLDATAQYSPFEFPSSMIQGKQALVALNEQEYQIVRVPEVPKEKTVVFDSSFFRLEKGMVKGAGQSSISGFAKVFNAYRLNRRDEKETQKYLSKLLSRGSNKFFLGSYQIENLQDLDKPLGIGYTFSVSDYYREIGDEIYFNLNMDKPFHGDFIDKERTLPIENEFKYTNRQVSVVEIPDGYQLQYLPKNDSFSNEVFGYSIKYRPEKGKITLEKELFVNYLLLQPQEFACWNEGIKKLGEAYSETIILEKKGVTNP